MFNFLHTFLPNSILINVGPITVYWYGLFMVLALTAGLLVSLQIAKQRSISKDMVYDLFFYLVLFGFLGARLFYILYNFNYFWQNPLDVFKIWQGGIAIHGALIFGVLVLLWFARNLALQKIKRSDKTSSKQQYSNGNRIAMLSDSTLLHQSPRNDIKNWFWKLAAIIAPGVVLGQAIGRWGNYFNQELFGLPTALPWGIPISLANRPPEFEMFEYFHPTFLYESIGNFIIFIILLAMHWRVNRKTEHIINNTDNDASYAKIAISYLLLYSVLRFFIEFLRIDKTAGSIFGVRMTQSLSFLVIIACVGYLFYFVTKRKYK